MSTASLNGLAVTRARVIVPAWGVPWIDCDVTEDDPIADAVTFVLADITIACFAISGGAHSGRASYRLAAGVGGWGKVLPAKPYADDMGIKPATLLHDAAREAGETLDESFTLPRVGPHYARASGVASNTLNAVAPRAWRVDFDGVTRIGARIATTYTGDGVRTHVDPAGMSVEIATEELAQLLPGVSIDGNLPATDVEYILEGGKLSARVYFGRRSSRRLFALSAILDALDPWRKYRATYEFRVVSQTGDRLNLQPIRSSTGMPSLERVPVRPGMAGLKSQVALGEPVLVAFADGDPSRPQVTNHAAVGDPGWMPINLELGEAPTLGVARLTDTVQAGPFAGVITGASARIKAGL